MNLKLLLIPLLILMRPSQSLEFSNAEWIDPGRPGSSVWLKNGKPKAVRIESIFIRNDGFQTGDEVALKGGKAKLFFASGKPKPGQWTRLTPKKGNGRIRIRAKDSLLVTGFEYGKRLQAKKPRRVVKEEYVLDLKLMDDKGDSAIVKISESAPNYIIEGAAGGSGSGGSQWLPRAGISKDEQSGL